MESGAYEIQIGENAQDIVLSSRVTVNSVTDIPKVYTRNSTIGEILADTNGKEIFQKTMAQMLGDNAQLVLYPLAGIIIINCFNIALWNILNKIFLIMILGGMVVSIYIIGKKYE